MTKINELRSKSSAELEQMLADLRAEVRQHSLEDQEASGAAGLRSKRRDIARVLTILREQEIIGELGGQG